MNIQEFTTEQLKAELKARGYYTDNLWQEADIDTVVENYNEENGTSIELTKYQKQEILDGVLTGDGTMQDVNDQLAYFFDDYVDNEGLIAPEMPEYLKNDKTK